MQSIKDLIKSVKTETELSELDIEKILSNSEDINYLEDITIDDISKTTFDIIGEYIQEKDTHEKYCNRLAGYRHVERVCDIRTNRHTRWLKGSVLHNGGMCVNIRIGDSIYLLCKTHSPRYPFITCNFNEVILFQKLTDEESFLLMANKMIK
jgi:hypothetical protein